MYVVRCRLRVLTTQLKAFRIELLAFVLFLKNSMASDRPLWVVLLRRTTRQPCFLPLGECWPL